MITVTVREYARLTPSIVPCTLDEATVSASAFDWLCQVNAQFRRYGAALLQMEGRQWLRLDNYVGVIETPCGTRVEILPKHLDHADDAGGARKLLCKMLKRVMNLPSRDVGGASIERFDMPLTEWVMREFLQALDLLVTRGIRCSYLRIEEEQRYLRGQIDSARQMRQPFGRQHLFNIRHDVFSANRPENRLLRKALDTVGRMTQDAHNWRLARELATRMWEIPASVDVTSDFRQWSGDRLIAHYDAVKPWCELVLNRQVPVAQAGDWRGISMLFPMERLFERYVASVLRENLPPGVRLRTQVSSAHLCTHDDSEVFELRPDLMFEAPQGRFVLDTKWKRLDAGDKANHYGLSQGDLYQLFAYGHKYLGGRGDLALIYPKTASLPSLLPPFRFSEQLTLWVVPFDLDENRLVDGAAILPFLYESTP